MMKLRPDFTLSNAAIERDLIAHGFASICGCDEAGRGPLAGPVVGAAVLFRDCETLWHCRDSKTLTERIREDFFEKIVTDLSYSFTTIDADRIDEVNIRVASLEAMETSVLKLEITPSIVYVDGRDRLPGLPNSRALVKGDALMATISAASIVAKVARDRLMRDFALRFPEYGFDRHYGYPTAQHRAALRLFGPCPIHRKTFRGVRELVE
ncbi:MAG: ribonuclease HII [bacterium]|nr:ribonuclease HII [bacterium]